MILFYGLRFFKKGDTIQGGSLFKGGHYLRKYGISVLIDVQANLPETSPLFVCPIGFGEHLFLNVYGTYLGCITLALYTKALASLM